MYDYMKALQDRFDHQEHTELDEQVKCAQEELQRDMDAVGAQEAASAAGRTERVAGRSQADELLQRA